MENKKIKEIFRGMEEMVKTVLDLEMDNSVESSKVIHTKNKSYVFSIKIQPEEVQKR